MPAHRLTQPMMQTQSRLRNRRGFRVAAQFAAMWFALFALLVPIIHNHEDQAGCAATLSAATTVAQAATMQKQHNVVRPGVDDCPICQWFSVGFTPSETAFVLALFAAALVQLLFDVRRDALCNRPRPRLGLRAPPVFSC